MTDSGGKFRLYRELPSFEAYLLISQEIQIVDIFEKAADGTWNLCTVRGAGAIVRINTLGIEFSLVSLYADLEIRLPELLPAGMRLPGLPTQNALVENPYVGLAVTLQP